MTTPVKLLFAGICLISLSAFIQSGFQQKPWPVPDAAKNKKNPVANNATTVATGKNLWGTFCKSCHGTKGTGDGPKASQLSTEPGDFSTNTFQGQTDGSIFYKTSEGRDDMPSFKTKIPNADDIWSLVNYMRTLKKGGVTPTTPTNPITPAKDTAKKNDKPVVVTPPVKKDTAAKKDPVVVVDKPVTLSLQEQISRLGARVDSLERMMNSMKTRLDSLQH